MIAIPYGKSHLDVAFPYNGLLTSRVDELKSDRTGRELVEEAMASPIGTPGLAALAAGKKRCTIIISDHTRPVPSRDILPPMLAQLRQGNPEIRVTLLVATGFHRLTTTAELEAKLGKEIAGSEKIVVHDAFDPESNVQIGVLPSGAPLVIDRTAVDTDLLIAEGFIEPHFFAGFSGGRKSILPGISSRETIFHNHAFSLDAAALRSNPAVGNGILQGNPLHEDMCEAAGLVKNLFMVNLVMNTQMRLAAIFSGHYLTSWEQACRTVNRIYQVDVPRKADVVITSCGGFPKDISLYQGTKAIDNVESALKPGGTLILVIEAREGGGPAEYFGWSKDLLAGTIEQRLREHFTVAGYVFFLNCEQAQRYNILLYSSIDPKAVEPMGIRAFSDVEALLEAARLPGKTVYVIPNGATVIPHIVKEAFANEA